jgi:hypothetical protein
MRPVSAALGAETRIAVPGGPFYRKSVGLEDRGDLTDESD